MKNRIINLIVLLLACLAFSQVAKAGSNSTSNVNVVNTPNVNVANTPSVSVVNTPGVNVANFPTFQRVQDRDNPARQPVSLHADAIVTPVTPTYVVFPVSAGVRLVIEQVSVVAYLSAGDKMRAAVETTTGGTQTSFYIPGTDSGEISGSEELIASSQMRCYQDGDSYFTVEVGASGGGPCSVNVSGYLIDLP